MSRSESITGLLDGNTTSTVGFCTGARSLEGSSGSSSNGRDARWNS
jgi:hypothetical protein